MGIKTDNKIYKRKDGRWCVSYYGSEDGGKRHYIYGKTKGEIKTKLAMLAGKDLEEDVNEVYKKNLKKRKSTNEEVVFKDISQKQVEKVLQKSDVEVPDYSINILSADQKKVRVREGDKWTLQAWLLHF